MLGNAKLQTIIWTSRIAQAERFYTDVLGLPLYGRSDGALVYHVNGADLRVSPVPSTQPGAHTVLGFAVSHLEKTVIELQRRGVEVGVVSRPTP